MKNLMAMAAVAASMLSGCATQSASTSTAQGQGMNPLERSAALEVEARGLRTKIRQLKQEVVIFEVMLTDVERRAAMSQIPLSNLPSTNLLAEPGPPASPPPDRLSVSVRPAPAAPALAKPLAKTRHKASRRQSQGRPAARPGAAAKSQGLKPKP